jgi:hypothetical protein
MKAYVVTTGAIFGLIAIAHLWRIVAESRELATEPWFVALTVVAVVLCAWAVRVARRLPAA